MHSSVRYCRVQRTGRRLRAVAREPDARGPLGNFASRGVCRKAGGYQAGRLLDGRPTSPVTPLRGHGAWTSWARARKVSEIRLSSTLARKGWYTRRSIIDHELGPANGAGHSATCTSRMWPHYRCRNGLLPPRTFTKTERAKLARW